MDEPSPGTFGDERLVPLIDAAIHRYVSRMARRYLPIVVGILLLIVLLIEVPSKTVPGQGAAGSSGSIGQAAPATGGAGTLTAPTGAAAGGGPAAAPTAIGNSPAAAAGGSPLGASVPGATGSAALAAGEAGIARSGVHCGAGVRQVTWSRYAPACVPTFAGANGGATSFGVTAKTITVSYRISNSGESAAVNAASGAAAVTDSQYLSDLRTYIDLFNKQFELYGRQVVLKVFTGQGDFLQEVQGQDQAGAQADGVTAHDMGAFADISLASASQFYQEALISQRVVAMGGIYMSQDWFAQHAPYAFAAFYPMDTSFAYGTISTVCNRMIGMPAIFAGDAVMQKRTRVFGELNPENPVYDAYGNIVQASGKSTCGLNLAKRIRYALDITTAEQQAVNIVAQLKAANVTTVICGCDPLVPIFLSNAANQQGYHPEWMSLFWGDLYGRLPDQGQWGHAIETGVYGQVPKPAADEAFRAFQVEKPGQATAEPYFDLPYTTALQLFAALQAAGPDLTPTTFAQGEFALPPSDPAGTFGGWRFGAGVYDPIADYTVAWWSPSATSNGDGKTGAWQPCNGGARYRWQNPANIGSGQLACFGR